MPEQAKLKNYHPYWFSKPGGRGGVAILSKTLAHHVEYGLGDEELDYEGRIITAEFEKFYLICVYVPNAGQKLVTLPRRLRWNKMFENHVAKLNQMKPVIICGDMNVAHTEIGRYFPFVSVRKIVFLFFFKYSCSTFIIQIWPIRKPIRKMLVSHKRKETAWPTYSRWALLMHSAICIRACRKRTHFGLTETIHAARMLAGVWTISLHRTDWIHRSSIA